MSEYEERDIKVQGETYVKHVSAMTGEDLHFKSDIAAELAHRDIEIKRLKDELKRQCTECPLNRRDVDKSCIFSRRQAD